MKTQPVYENDVPVVKLKIIGKGKITVPTMSLETVTMLSPGLWGNRKR